MADLNPLAQEVANLKKTTGNDFEFMDALDHIEAAAKTTDQEIDQLRGILSRFRNKLPNRETLDVDRIRAKDLGDSLMLISLQDRLARINARNETLAALTSKLKVEIDKGNADASLLQKIKNGIDKATKTVQEAKSLIDQLTATNATTKTRLKALIEKLATVSKIFQPGA